MGPENPALTSVGSAPEWSICACERITEEIDFGSNPNTRFRSKLSSRRPCTIPQSRRTLRPSNSRRCRLPVTVRAAPWKASFIVGDYSFAGYTLSIVRKPTVARITEANPQVRRIHVIGEVHPGELAERGYVRQGEEWVLEV